MAGLYFAHNGLLNDWAASNGIEVVDAGQPLLSYDATPDGEGVKATHCAKSPISSHA